MQYLPIAREQLPQHIKDNFLTDDNLQIVEVGSYEGTYAKIIHECFPNSSLSLIDMWETAGNDFFYSAREGEVELAYQVALSRFENNNNVRLIKQKSTEAASLFADNSIDFIYIDADHSYEGCLSDLHAWYSKVKKGGIISGHDWDCDPSHPNFDKFAVRDALFTFFGEQIENVMLTSERFYKSWALIK